MALEKIERTKIRSDILVGWLTLLGVIAGGVFAVIEIQEDKARSRVEHSLQFANRVWEPPIAPYRAIVEKTLTRVFPEVEKILTDKTVSDEAAAKGFKDIIISAVEKDEDVRQAVTFLIFFYEQVAVCAIKNVCDPESVTSLVGNDAQVFFRQVVPYVCKLRSQWSDPSFARSFEQYFNPGSPPETCKAYE